ncbi:MAG: hypothetical protein WC711_03705 [Candidatus Staskawiczbacteria bacterium]|jgi:hypothetical protein
MNIQGYSLCELLGHIEDGLRAINPKQSCGYATIMVINDSGFVVYKTCRSVGLNTLRDEGNHYNRSIKQADRLFAHPKHVSSYQSRNPRQNQGAGAIRAGSVILSFSGLTSEFCNEALVLWVAHVVRWLSVDEAFNIARLSGNPLVDDNFFALARR